MSRSQSHTWSTSGLVYQISFLRYTEKSESARKYSFLQQQLLIVERVHPPEMHFCYFVPVQAQSNSVRKGVEVVPMPVEEEISQAVLSSLVRRGTGSFQNRA
jgi:hypothetical protein